MGGFDRSDRLGNLPVEVTSLIGRRRAVLTAKELLRSARLLTLIGPGGIGKTRLALRVAAEVNRAFPDGVWLVELASLEDSDLVANAVADAIGLRDLSGEPVDRLSEFLQSKRLLLVLDNCEHLLDECGALVTRLLARAPELRILATSRQPLGVEAEQVFLVAGLSVPSLAESASRSDLSRFESVNLFVERAKMAVFGFEITDDECEPLVQLCRRLDGIPLAIELAAARIRSLTVRQLVERLECRLDVLSAGRYAELPRHRTLRAAIGWSFDLCSPGEQLLWARCSVFADGFDLEAAEAVCCGQGIAAEQVLDLVAALVDKSVLAREENTFRSRYRLLETVRQYGREKLSCHPERIEVSARHRDYYLRLSERAESDRFGPRHGEWLARLLSEHSNLRAALEFCMNESGQEYAGLEIAAALQAFWIDAGLHNEGRHWLDRALEVNPEPTRCRAKALGVCGYLNFWLGARDRALSLLAEGRALAERVGDGTLAARAMLYSGAVALQQRDRTGFSLLQDALDRLRATEDSFGVWIALEHLAMGACEFDAQQALAYTEEALSLCRAHGAHVFRSHMLPLAGLVHWQLGEGSQAAALANEALRLKRSSGDLPWGIAQGLEILAFIACGDGQHRKAAVLLGAAQTVWAIGGSPLVRPWYLRTFRDECVRNTRDALGDDAYVAAFAEGTQLTLVQAVARALDERTDADSADSAPADGIADLTPRERQVAGLVAEGQSNKQIANTLVISQRTAEGHVEHILTKLGFARRAQIAAWMTERRGAVGSRAGTETVSDEASPF